MPRTLDAPTKFYTTEQLSGNLKLTPDNFLLCENVPLARTGSMIYGPGETDVEVGPGGYAVIECEADELFRPETVCSANGKPVLDEHPTSQDHGVGPDNWPELAKGTILNPRRGSGDLDSEHLYGDLLIMSQDLIETVLGIEPGSFQRLIESGEIQDAIKNRHGKREVSLGYEADYEQLEPGKGRKVNIVINHVAVVKSGRCGSGCKVTDHLPERTRKKMKQTLVDRLKKAFKTKDEEGFNQMLESEVEPMAGDSEGGEGGVHVHLHHTGVAPTPISGDKKTKDGEGEGEGEGQGAEPGALRSKFTDEELESRFQKIGDALEEIKGMVGGQKPAGAEEPKKNEVEEDGDYVKPKEGAAYDSDREIEGALEEEAPEGTGDVAKKSTDSAFLVESMRDTVAMAEILAPGVKIPTFDKAWHPRVTIDNICRLRKAALVKALDDAGTREMIVSVRGGRTTDAAVIRKLTCDSARTLFNTAAAMKKAQNNATLTGSGARKTNDNARPQMAVRSIADINKKNQEFYKA